MRRKLYTIIALYPIYVAGLMFLLSGIFPLAPTAATSLFAMQLTTLMAVDFNPHFLTRAPSILIRKWKWASLYPRPLTSCSERKGNDFIDTTPPRQAVTLATDLTL